MEPNHFLAGPSLALSLQDEDLQPRSTLISMWWWHPRGFVFSLPPDCTLERRSEAAHFPSTLRPPCHDRAQGSTQQPLPTAQEQQAHLFCLLPLRENLAWGKCKAPNWFNLKFQIVGVALLYCHLLLQGAMILSLFLLCVLKQIHQENINNFSTSWMVLCLGWYLNIHQAHQHYEQNNFSP